MTTTMYIDRLATILWMIVGIANAFHASLPHTTRQVTPPACNTAVVTRPTSRITSTTARFVIMTDEEVDKIVKGAANCAEGECSVDEVSDLIQVLKEQQTVLEDRMEKVMNMIADLQHLNEKEERQTEDVRGVVRDMLRVFNNDKTIAPATGFSGDIGEGSMTAWDALPPKKWKPNSSDKK